MIKLILSDIDGTLMREGENQIPPALFALIPRLRERGILFCPASGRQFHSLRGLFAPVAEELVFLCENGAAVYGPGSEESAPLLSRTELERETALALAEHMCSLPGAEPLISGVSRAYLVEGSEELLRIMRDGYDNRLALISDPREITEPIIKEAAFIPRDFERWEGELRARWAGKLNVARAGRAWLDFTVADKGTGLRGLCAALGIRREEVMAFGDNWNDVPMLDAAGTPYIMTSAAPELLARYPNHCANVIEVLEGLIA
ncbi:MAG: HAD family hydrolase [bacterium]